MTEECFPGGKNEGISVPTAESGPSDVAADGSLANNRVFIDMSSAEAGVPDGMKVDTQGRVYCTGSGGIWVIDPSGNRLGVIRCQRCPAIWLSGDPA